MAYTWYIILFLFFTFLGLLIGIFFFLKKRGDRWANRLLGIYTLLFSFELLQNCLRWLGHLWEPKFAHINLSHWPLWLIYGPLLYLYARRVITERSFHLKDLLLFLPAVLLGGLIFPFYRLSAEEKASIAYKGEIFDYIYIPASSGIWIILFVMLLYGCLTYFSFWNNKRIGFRENIWLKWFVGSYFGYVFAFAAYIFVISTGIMHPRYDYFIDIIIVLFIGMLSFFGFVQPEVFEGKRLKEILPFVKYRKTGLSDALSREMKQKLVEQMEGQKLYLNNELRLDDIAKVLNLSRNHASQIINEHFNLSFFDFVNEYRVEEAKRILLENKRDGGTITQIAYDVGFNNRASFYKAFKKFSGESPGDYMNHMRAS